MRSQLLASLTSKLVAGVAATALAAGSAGAVAMTTISDEEVVGDVVAEQVIDDSDLAVDCDSDDAALQVFEEEVDTDTADGDEDTVDPCDDSNDDGESDDDSTDDESDDGESDDDGATDEDADDSLEDEDVAAINAGALTCAGDAAEYANFGQYVKELRACGFVGGVSELAHEKNRVRKEAKAAERTETPVEEESDDVAESDDVVAEAPVVEDDAEDGDDADDEEVEPAAAEEAEEPAKVPGAHGKGHAKKK